MTTISVEGYIRGMPLKRFSKFKKLLEEEINNRQLNKSNSEKTNDRDALWVGGLELEGLQILNDIVLKEEIRRNQKQ